ncbi:MAG: CcoQ/FixQ family Cbb3-type cytochrome c oxidase assembly chaperone [Cyclobacteriaceae bacterium]|nr:CcoQ/FixQ family Cbb3-type cytochrome c oxidase assembly chaperone [Cyclobacteriaceae bacterium SS2]
MLKFIKHHMETITGIEVYPLISLIIFVVFFIGLFIWIIKSDKAQMDEISRLPLDTKNEES